jgi:hypothetical protein
MKQKFIYDIEVLLNMFLFCARNIDTKEEICFEISQRKVQTKEFIEWLLEPKELYGFNCINYDGKVIQKLLLNKSLKPNMLCSTLKHHSDKLISDENYSRFQKRLALPNVLHVDLFLLHHFNNDAKWTSLKDLEFAFQMPNIQELHVDWSKPIPVERMDEVISYCWNDIEATEILYNKSIEALDFRRELSIKYNLDMMSFDSPKLGEKSFTFQLKEKLGDKVNLKTPRESINIGEIVFPYITFQNQCFTNLLTYFKSKVIKGTYKVFSEIPFEELEVIDGCYQVQKTKGVQKNLNIVHQGIKFVFGTGGIHACIEPGVYEIDDEHEIIDIDVSSFYPNLAIKNKLFPEHLGVEFCDIYEDRYYERGKYPKGSILNTSIKLELNGAYGKSNSKFSVFYDPKYTMSITINGQLLIVMLAEQLMEISQLLQANTDGVTIRVHKSNVYIVEDIIKWWQELTSLTLETAHYSKMIIKDVSNYLAVYTNGKVKRKGAAFKTKKELELHENHSALVVQEAINDYFIYGTNPIEFLNSYLEKNGIMDFCLRAKIQKQHQLVLRTATEDILLQKTVRYIVANEQDGNSLIKIMPPLEKKPDKWRESEIEAGWKCIVLNDLRNVNLEEIKEKINLTYYLNEVNKVINAINT